MAIQNIPVQTVAHGMTVGESALVDLSVREALLGLKNGQVIISVHNGEIIQIDRLLKKRQFKSRSHS